MASPHDSFRLMNSIASLRRRLFPAGTWRAAFYNQCLRPLGMTAFIALYRLRQAPSPTANVVGFDPLSWPNADTIRRIAVIKADHIGDFVFALPSLAALRRGFPNAKITLFCAAWNKALAEASGLIDEVITINLYAARIQQGVSGDTLALDTLPALPVFDIAIDLKYEPDTRFVLGYIPARFKAGYASPLMPKPMHLVMPHLPTLPPMRSTLLMLTDAVIAHFTSSTMVRHGAEVLVSRMTEQAIALPANRINIGIGLGSGAPTRTWPLNRFVALIGHLLQQSNTTVVLFGTDADKTAAQQICALHKNHPDILDYTGRLSLSGFVATLPQLHAYIGHETGSTHLAAALDIPTLCLFAGAGNINVTAPTGSRVDILPCSGCGLRDLSDCPEDQLCMTAITVDQVVNSLSTFFKNAA